ncbi:head GIN domain-containing protein [Undibacterium sp. Ji22W]|uniref:head GIN domain-containing protein n=1 Tax=Undibacterium sp. Ji22W TaxID=3413038 RepID=UPI003BF293F7
MRTIFALCSILAFSGCAIIIAPDGNDARFESAWSSNAIKGNGDVTSDKRQVNGMTALNVSGPLQVEVRVGAAPSLEIIGDSNLLNLVQTQVSGETQKIWIDEKFNSTNPIRVVYTVPAVTEITSNGSGRLMVNGLNGGNLAVRNNGSRSVNLDGSVSRIDIVNTGSGSINALGLMSKDAKINLQGSGSLNLGAVNGNELAITVNGSGSVHASGNVRNLVAQTHGSGSADLSAVKSLSADLNSYGSGSVTAAVSQNVNAQSNGSGSVNVYGNPAQRNVNGRRVNFIN